MDPNKTKRVIHSPDQKGKPICGAKQEGDYPDWNIRGDPDKVTCPRCLEMLPDA